MQAEDVLAIRPELDAFLRLFAPCLGRAQNRGNIRVYIGGLLSNLQRKSVEPIALAAGMAPRTLQEFLATAKWDHTGVRDRLQQRVASRHAHDFSIGVIDDTSLAKKGRKTPGVQRQYCGSLGKTENCVVSVHLGYAANDFQALLDSELFIPEHTWSNDTKRRREAGIPDDVVHRPKWRMALTQVERALANGVRFRFLTFDEAYSQSREFLRGLDRLGQTFVAEVSCDARVWTKEPAVLGRNAHPDRSKAKRPRLKKCNPKLCRVDNVLRRSPIARTCKAEMLHVHEGAKGPSVWEVKHMPVWIPDENGLPSKQHHLFFTRNPLDPKERVKYFLSNAPPSEPLEHLLRAAHSRWRIERLFQDAKDELGMDHFESRKYAAVTRHQLLCCVSLLFAAEFRGRRAEKKSGDHGEPSADGGRETGGAMDRPAAMHTGPGGGNRIRPALDADPQRGGGQESPAHHARPLGGRRHLNGRPATLP